MSIKEDSKLMLNEKECEYDIYGDTRNNSKHNEERPYAKYSYNSKNLNRIYNTIMKKEMQKEKYTQMKQKNQNENKENEDKKEQEKNKKEKNKRILKINNENKGNNHDQIIKKAKKNKRPKKDRIRY